MSDFKFIPAGHFTPSDHRDIWWIGIHTAETGETHQTAESVANYFAHTDVKASAHLTADDDSIVRSVLDKDVAYSAPGANRHGLHIELAGRAAQDAAGWQDQYSQDMLRLAAKAVAEWCQLYGIPAVKLSVADIKAGHKGIAGHVDFTHALGGSHTDPGPSFPWDQFIGLVRSHLQPAQDDAAKQTVLAALRIVYGQPIPPSMRQKLDALRDDPWLPMRT